MCTVTVGVLTFFGVGPSEPVFCRTFCFPGFRGVGELSAAFWLVFLSRRSVVQGEQKLEGMALPGGRNCTAGQKSVCCPQLASFAVVID